MVVRTIRTTYEESNRIADGLQTCIFRAEKDGYKPKDVFNFQCYKDGKPVAHKNNKYGYIVTMVQDWTTAPIAKDYVLVNFRRIER